jgi:hypothetical protein
VVDHIPRQHEVEAAVVKRQCVGCFLPQTQ